MVKVFLALDVELAVGASLQLESDDDLAVLTNVITDDRQVGSKGLDGFDETVWNWCIGRGIREGDT